MRWCTDNLKPTNVDIVRSAKEDDIIKVGEAISEDATAAQMSSSGEGD